MKFDKEVLNKKLAEGERAALDYLEEQATIDAHRDIIADLKFLSSKVNEGYPKDIYEEYRDAQLKKLGIEL